MIYLLRKHDIISVPSYAKGIYHPPKVGIISKIYHPFREERISLKTPSLYHNEGVFMVEAAGNRGHSVLHAPKSVEILLVRRNSAHFACRRKRKTRRVLIPLAVINAKKAPTKGAFCVGGGGGNRTRVRKSLDTAFSECSRSIEIPLAHRR